MKRITMKQLEGAIREYSRLNDGVKIDLYKGHAMSGRFGWIARRFGRTEWYLGANISDAYQVVMDWLGFQAESNK